MSTEISSQVPASVENISIKRIEALDTPAYIGKKTEISVVAFPFDVVQLPGGYETKTEYITYQKGV